MSLEVVVLAAGQGTRMRSKLPKVLHDLAGRPLLAHVLEAARGLKPESINVVVGHAASLVRAAFADARDVSWTEQRQQLGTGHALAQALPAVRAESVVLNLYGDVPLVRSETLRSCAAVASAGKLVVVTADVANPTGLGRIVRGANGTMRAIIEERDASPEQRTITEINSGILAAPAAMLRLLIGQLNRNNDQGEFYLTDIVGLAVERNIEVVAHKVPCADEVAGVNDRAELARLERIYQLREAQRLMAGGVTLRDPERFDARGDVQTGIDCIIDVDVVLEGVVRLGDGVRIGPGCAIRDAQIGDGAVIHAHTVIDGAVIGAGCELGPFARMRPGTVLAERVKIGNFVETKKTRLGAGTKSNHFAYLGDTTTGEDCNIGAGTIMCNYDGFAKHETHLGRDVFIGSNSTLVAPIEVGDGGYVAAGSTVTTKIAAGELAVGRARQRNIGGWVPPAKRGGDKGNH
ncbi:MAG TPA: bifunctional UDP-N-acetylglucosamine diphosphorylase/glucosamine-1-phosphate N-acetyltransferase GlmU [Pseudomonadales bacterium]|nr:bifunctional UDP-N-acetylglucosamine diphosphorylase/glucosamine-1-phosphate N-acetyltransferase GlmU [Pseudomonadales bacterium]